MELDDREAFRAFRHGARSADHGEGACREHFDVGPGECLAMILGPPPEADLGPSR